MRNRIRAVATACVAALAMVLAADTASANNLSYSTQRFRIIWTSLSFSEAGGNFPISCPVTLEGSFYSRTMAKVLGTPVAQITRAVVNNPGCSEGQATILAETLPWEVLYESFSGRLPTISSVRHYLIGAAFQIEPGLGLRCLARSSNEFPAAGDANREAGGAITSLVPDSTLAIPVRGASCPSAGIFSGAGEVFVLGSARDRVTLSLI